MATAAPTPSLDLTGTQAAYWPSEEQLWAYGPDPGPLTSEDLTPGAYQVPNPAADDDYLHETINGELTNEAIYEEWVNPENIGPTGFGDWSDAAWQTGHTQNVVLDPSMEQGWGVGPARRWSHYPFSELPNPFRNNGTDTRDGQYNYVSGETALYTRTQLEYQQMWAPMKQTSVHSAIVPLAPSVPYTQTVPTYSGGPLPIAGVDIPLGDEAYYG